LNELIVTVCSLKRHGTKMLWRTEKFCCSPSKDKSCGSRYPFDKRRNISCFEGHPSTPSDHKMQDNFTGGKVSHQQENMVSLQVLMGSHSQMVYQVFTLCSTVQISRPLKKHHIF